MGEDAYYFVQHFMQAHLSTPSSTLHLWRGEEEDRDV